MKLSFGSLTRKTARAVGLRTDAREYPIKRDERGDSARKRAFVEFDDGRQPKDVCETVGISLRTAYRYFSDWKKLPEKFAHKYQRIKERMQDVGSRRFIVVSISEALRISQEEVEAYLEQPWGIHKVSRGELGKRPGSKKIVRRHYHWVLINILMDQIGNIDPPVGETIPTLIDILTGLKQGDKVTKLVGMDDSLASTE